MRWGELSDGTRMVYLSLLVTQGVSRSAMSESTLPVRGHFVSGAMMNG